jgi:hypothetical protein
VIFTVRSWFIYLFSLALQSSANYVLLVSRGFFITHNDTLQSVQLLWTSDQLVAETSTWQHTTHTTEKHPCQGGIRTHDRSRRAAVDLRLRPGGHWDRRAFLVTNIQFEYDLYLSFINIFLVRYSILPSEIILASDCVSS